MIQSIMQKMRRRLSLNYELKLAKKYHGNVACMVCSHVLADANAVGFVLSAKNEWVAFCSEDCSDSKNVNKLSLIHLSHILDDQPNLTKIFAIPINFIARRDEELWRYYYDYDVNDYEETLGDYVAISQNHPVTKMCANDLLLVYELEHKKLVTVVLDTTLRIVPVWTKNPSEEFSRKLRGDEKLVRKSMSEIAEFCSKEGIDFLAYDFMILDVDYAFLLQKDWVAV